MPEQKDSPKPAQVPGDAESSPRDEKDQTIEEAVKKEVLSVGFKFEGASDVLRNKDDPHTAKVFDPNMRGHTDQFIFKFRKPKK